MQQRAPAHRPRAIRLAPEPRDQRAHQQLLRERHARVRRHLERAQLDEPEPARRSLGRVELVDAELGAMRVAGDVGEQVAVHAIDEPRRTDAGARIGHRARRDLELVHRVVARLVDPRRLAGRADEQPRKEIRERGMILPVVQQAAQQIGAAQERAVGRRGTAEHDVVAAAGSRVPAVEQELLGREAQRARVGIERGGLALELAPARRGAHVHLEHARVGRDAHLLDPRIERHRVALEHDRARELLRGVLDRVQELEVVVGARERR